MYGMGNRSKMNVKYKTTKSLFQFRSINTQSADWHTLKHFVKTANKYTQQTKKHTNKTDIKTHHTYKHTKHTDQTNMQIHFTQTNTNDQINTHGLTNTQKTSRLKRDKHGTVNTPFLGLNT